MHNAKRIMDSTTDSRTYYFARKRYLEGTGRINCSYCPYHKYENCTRSVSSFRSWKQYRRKQWHVILM